MILHYQRLGKFGVNIDDTWPMSEDTEDPDPDDNAHPDETIIDDIETDEDKEEVDPDTDEEQDEDTLCAP
jgi:hypothetical protein